MSELLANSMYVVDERAVAEAILLRARTRTTIAEQLFRSEQRAVEIRSFRRTRGARPFRLSTGRMRHMHH